MRDASSKPLTVLRHVRRSNFTVLPNEMLQDSRLSLRATGLLSRMLSLPSDWKFSADRLAQGCEQDGRKVVLNAMNDLQSHGYLRRQRERVGNGRFATVVTVSDTPIPEWIADANPIDPDSERDDPVALTSDDIANPQVGSCDPNLLPVPTSGNTILSQLGPEATHGTSVAGSSIERTQTENPDKERVCVGGSDAAADELQNSAPVAEPGTTAGPKVSAEAASVVCRIYTAEQRLKITLPDQVADIAERVDGLIGKGWTVDGINGQLQQHVHVNTRTVAFGKILIDALTRLDGLIPNAASVDPFAQGAAGIKEPARKPRSQAKKSTPVPEDHPGFAAFWDAYGHKVGSKAKARKSYTKALQHTDDGTILAATQAYRTYLDSTGSLQAHATTWLNQHRWEDDYSSALAAEQSRVRPAPAAPVRESLSARRNREIDDALAAVKAELAGAQAPDGMPDWSGAVIDSEGRPA